MTDYKETVINDNPVAYWRLGEIDATDPAHDEMLAYHGAYTGTPTMGEAGLVKGDNDSINIDGATEYMSLSYDAALNPSVFSFEAWAKLSGGSGTLRTVADCLEGDKGFNLRASTGNTWDVRFGTGSTITTLTGSAATVGTTYHLVATYDGTDARLYVDGVLAAGPTTLTFVPNDDQVLYIGVVIGEGSRFQGNLDEVAIYDYALSSDQIKAHYNAGKLLSLGTLLKTTLSKQTSITQTLKGFVGRAKSTTLQMFIADENGSYRGAGTEAERDALAPKYTGDTWANSETDIVEVYNGSTWDPVIGDSLAESKTIPSSSISGGPISDGSAPASSPTPTVQGGPNFLLVKWTPIANDDVVTYEVHISTTSGFTPSAGTKVGEVTGSMLFIRKMPDNSDLEYFETDGTTTELYYVKIVATDADGSASASAEGSGSLAQINSEDIAAEAITASHILAGEITSEHLSAVQAWIDKTLVVGNETSAHITIDSTVDESGTTLDGGITIRDHNQNIIFRAPLTADETATFAGNVDSDSITTRGLTLQGGSNVIDDGGMLTLTSQLSPPAAPSLNANWEAITVGSTFDYASRRGLFYTASGGDSGATAVFHVTGKDPDEGYFYHRAYTVSANANQDIASGVDQLFWSPTYTSIHGGVRISGDAFTLLKTGGNYYLFRDGTSGFGFTDVTSDLGGQGDPALFVGPSTTLGIATTNGSGVVRFRYYNTGTLNLSSTTTTTGKTISGGTVGVRDVHYDGTDFWVIIQTGASGSYPTSTILKYNGSAAYQSGQDWGTDHGIVGITKDATRFYTSRSSTTVNKHSTWDTNGLTVYVATVWTDDSSVTTRGDYTSIDMDRYRFARIAIGTGTKPSGVTKSRVYALTSAPGTMKRQTATTYIDSETNQTIYMKDYNSAGANEPGSNTWPGGDSSIEPTDNTTHAGLHGDGDGFLPIGMITPFGGSSAPTGWLLCDGSAVSRTTYANLFAIVSTTFGTGDGSTTFNLPDLRQRFPMGVAASGTGNSLGATGGTIDHTHDSHGTAANTRADAASNRLTGNGLGDGNTHSAVNPPFLAVNYIIKT